MHRAVRSVVPSLARTLCATAVVVAVGFALFGPIVVHPNSRVLDTFSDAATQMRLYDVMEESGQNPFTFEHDPMNGAPEGYPILTSVQIAAPIQPSFVWAFKDVLGIIGSVNAFLLSGLLLTGVAMFLLLDRCRFGFLPSLFGALLVAFNPWMFERAVSGHIAFAHGWVLIVLLFALLRLREQRTLPRAAAAGAAYGFCFLMASYSGLLATFMVAGFAILDVVSAKTAVERLWTLTLLMMIGAVTAVFLLPGVIALARDGDRVTSSLSRSTEDLTLGGASPLHYVFFRLPGIRYSDRSATATDLGTSSTRRPYSSGTRQSRSSSWQSLSWFVSVGRGSRIPLKRAERSSHGSRSQRSRSRSSAPSGERLRWPAWTCRCRPTS